MRLADPSIEPSVPQRYQPSGRQGRPMWRRVGEPANAEGVLRDRFSFFQRFDYQMPGALSDANLGLLRRGYSPVVDEPWVKAFPEHRTFMGETLQHHHLLGTELAIPLPESLHTGAVNTKVWHP